MRDKSKVSDILDRMNVHMSALDFIADKTTDASVSGAVSTIQEAMAKTISRIKEAGANDE